MAENEKDQLDEVAQQLAQPYVDLAKKESEALFKNAGAIVINNDKVLNEKVTEGLTNLTETICDRRARQLAWKELKENSLGLDLSDVEPEVENVHELMQSSDKLSGSLFLYYLMAFILVVSSVFSFYYRSVTLESKRRFMENLWLSQGVLLSCNYLEENRKGTPAEVKACQNEMDRRWLSEGGRQ